MSAPVSPIMQEAMLARAAEVRRDGAYLGFLEWVVWGHLYSKRVEMMFGTMAQELLSWFAPGLGRANDALPWTTARVAAVRMGPRPGEWLAPLGQMPRINHYVVGVATFCKDGIASCERILEGSTPRCARRAAMRAGCRCMAT